MLVIFHYFGIYAMLFLRGKINPPLFHPSNGMKRLLTTILPRKRRDCHAYIQ